VLKCNDSQCSPALNSINVVDPSNVIGHTSMAIGTDGFPVISYVASSGVKVAKCLTADCSGTPTITLIDSVISETTSITIGLDGNPIMSFGNSLFWKQLNVEIFNVLQGTLFQL